MSVISSDFRIPNDNRPHLKVDVLYRGKQITMIALIDTGAQSCCISSEKAEELGLPILGKAVVAGSTGEKPMNIYKIDSIRLPNGFTYNKDGILGYAKCAGTADIILGMDVLGSGLLSVSFDGRMIIAL